MSKIAIIGHRGYLGSALAKRVGDYTSYPTKDTEMLFYLASTVHPQFEENPDYHLNKVIQDFLYLLPFCRDNNIKFVYASSALVYEKDTVFAKCKKIMEMLASCYPNTVGLRIFPVYGGKENRTVISKWCKEMKEGKRPQVYGNGTQKRDFIHIDDVVEQMLHYSNGEGIYDIGTGRLTSFNQIIECINQELKTKIKPEYIKAPQDYSKGIYSKKPFPKRMSVKEGIKKICNS